MGAHAHHDREVEVDPQIARSLWTTLGMFALVVLVAVAVLWPGGSEGADDPLLLDADPVPARVDSDEVLACSVVAEERCRLIRFEVTGGEYDGLSGSIEVAIDNRIRSGDDILLTVFETESGRLVFDFYDFQRGSPMVVLAVLFAAAVVVLGRWRGVGALAGLAVSLLVIVVFAVPAILDGSNAVTVAVVAASVIAFCSLFLAHGFEVPTAVALVSTLLSLFLTAALAWAFVGATHLTGLTDDSTLLLAGLRDGIDARGILLAGIVIGALGVLDDVTVTQVSAVWELKALRPSCPCASSSLRRCASAAITSRRRSTRCSSPMPALRCRCCCCSRSRPGVGSVITRELVATEVVRTLVGSIGLVASVPISTGWRRGWPPALRPHPRPTSSSRVRPDVNTLFIWGQTPDERRWRSVEEAADESVAWGFEVGWQQVRRVCGEVLGHLPGGRVDHAGLADHDGRDRLVAVGVTTHDRRVGRVVPDVVLDRVDAGFGQPSAQHRAEHAARSPVDVDGVGQLAHRKGSDQPSTTSASRSSVASMLAGCFLG